MQMPPSPDRILHYAIGPWLGGIMAAAVHLDLFRQLAEAPSSAAGLAARASISLRGAQALLDGLLGLGLVTTEHGSYHISETARRHLAKGGDDDLRGLSALAVADMGRWPQLAEIMRGIDQPADSSAPLPGIAALASVAALAAARRIGLDTLGPCKLLDASDDDTLACDWRRRQPGLELTRAAWRELDASGEYDIAIWALRSHRLSPADNLRALLALRKALRPGAVLLLVDVMVDNDRSGDAWALAFHAQVVLRCRQGAVYRRCDYDSWLRQAGFTEVLVEQLDEAPLHLLYAR